jgi:hypothetical protein
MMIWIERGGENLLPAAVEMPAPVKTTILFFGPFCMYSATADSDLSVRDSGGTDSSTMVDSSWPILRRSQRGSLKPCFW